MIKYVLAFFLLFLYSKNPLFSQTVKDSLWALLHNTHTDSSKIKILNKLHAYYTSESSESRNVDSAEHYANIAYALAIKTNPENYDAWNAIRAKAIFAFQEKKDPVNAVKLYLKANSISEKLRDTLNIGNGFIAIGNIYTYQHLTEKAKYNYLESLYYFEKKNAYLCSKIDWF